MATAITNYLQKLDSVASNSSSVTEPVAVVQDLRNLCFHEINEQELGLYSSLIFHGDHSLLKFLISTLTNQDKQLVKTREAVLFFISTYIKTVKKRIQDYALEIKETCFNVFRREQSNTVKIASFKPIVQLIKLRLSLLDGDRIGVREMAEKYLNEFTCGKSSQTVKSNILRILGMMTEYYPTHMFDKTSQLMQLLLESLQRQFKASKPDLQIIAGALAGLTALLVNFSGDFISDASRIQTLYQYIRLALDIPSHITRYTIPKCGLRLVAMHAEILKEYLTEDSEQMFTYLSNMCKHQNRPIRQRAFPALEAFFAQVSKEIISGNRNPSSDQATFKFFARKFHDLLHSTDMYDTSIAIRGYGHFAAPIQRFMGVWELRRVLMQLLQTSESYYKSNTSEDSIAIHLSSFISSFAKIIMEMDKLEDTYIDNLEGAMGALFVVYPQLTEEQRFSHYKSLFQLFAALHAKGPLLKTLLSRSVYQGLLLTCSNAAIPVAPQTASDNNVSDGKPGYLIYEDLWKHMLKRNGTPPTDAEIQAIVFDELISAMITFMNKLDFSYNVTEDVLTPNNPKDMELFANLVEFGKLTLPSADAGCFHRWVYLFGKELVAKANEYPLISGFYILLALIMQKCKEGGYFDVIPDKEELGANIDAGESMQVDSDANANALLSFVLFDKFFGQVVARLHQYKDELLAGCLELVLSVPRQFIRVASLVPALQIALKMGISYLPLASIALNALEHWIEIIPRSVRPHLPQILPYLNDYLLVTESESGEKAEETQAQETPMSIQRRIIRFLGKLGGDNVHLIDEVNFASGNGNENGIVWDASASRVKFVLPFQDIKLDNFYLDSFLPRIVALAEGANDKPTKSAAEELLHSLILFILGSSASGMRKKDTQVSFKKIYERMFPVLLRISSQPDQIGRQLFEPLVFQLIHWFTQNAKHENEETMVLLDAIVEAVGNSTDGGLRDFSSKCLAEFLKWSIKHTSKRQQENNPFNAKSLFKRLYSLARHPNPYQRLGFALTLNQICGIFRAEEALVDQFVLEIVHNSIFALRLCHDDDPTMGTSNEMATAISNFCKIITSNIALLNKPNKNRRLHSSLQEFVEWLFAETSRHESRSRAECMKLFSTLVTAVPGTKSAEAWILQRFASNSAASVLAAMQPKDAPFLLGPDKTHTDVELEELNYWFTHLITSLDCYIWLADLVPGLFHMPNFKSNILSVVNQFVRGVSMNSKISYEKFQRNKCQVTLRILEFLVVLVTKYHAQATPLLHSSLIELVFWCLLLPSEVGFQLNDLQGMTQLQHAALAACNTLITLAKKELLAVLAPMLASQRLSLFHFGFSAGLNVQEALHLTNGYKKLHECGLLLPSLSTHGELTVEDLATRLLSMVFHADTSSPLQHMFATQILQLALSLHPDHQILMKFLLDDTVDKPTMDISLGTMETVEPEPEPQEVDTTKLTKGELFYGHFRPQIANYMVHYFAEFANSILSNVRTSPFFYRIFANVLEEAKSVPEHVRNAFLQLFLNRQVWNWLSLEIWIATNSNVANKYNVVDILDKLVQLDTGVLSQSTESVFSQYIIQVFESFMDENGTLFIKTKVLETLLLPMLTIDPQLVRKALNSLIVCHFPSNSADLPAGTNIFKEYVSAVDALLRALERSGNLIVLETLFPLLKERTKHVHFRAIEASLQTFVRQVSEEKAKAAFDLCFSHSLDNKYPDGLRSALVEQLCIPLLNKMSIPLITQAFIERIKPLMEILVEESFGHDEFEVKTRLMEKTLMYKTVPPNVIKEKINPAYSAQKDAKGNELTTAVMRAAHAAKTFTMPASIAQNQEVKEVKLHTSLLLMVITQAVRMYCCSAYNTLAAAVCGTQNRENFFTVFFFKENPDKNERVWEGLIDLEQSYKFEVETNFSVAQLQQISTIAAERKQANEGLKGPVNHLFDALEGSSLSQDLNQKTHFFGSKPSDPDVSKTSIPEENEELPAKESAQEIELDAINSHPCMPVILNLIDQIQAKFPHSDAEMPKWMYELHLKFTHPDTHPNVLLFLLKIIINRENVFKPYASFWTRPIMQFAISGERDHTFHYWLRDICILLLKWGAVPKATPEERRIASLFMGHLIACTGHPNKEVVRSNVEIIQLLGQAWKQRFYIFKKQLFDLLTHDSVSSRVVGLQVLGVLLVGGYQLDSSEPGEEISGFKFLDSLLNNLHHARKEVYCAAAEVLGLALHQAPTDNISHQLLKDRVTSMFTKAEHERLLNCLTRISLHFPEFLNYFFLHIVDLLPKLSNEIKLLGLQLVLSHSDKIDNLMTMIQADLPQLLLHRDENLQLTTLRILLKLADGNQLTESVPFDTLAQTFTKHINTDCRIVYYDLLLRLYTPQVKKIKTHLLRGLIDEHDAIRKKVFQFWDSQLSLKIGERLVQVFSNLYDNGVEEHWVSYSTCLLLALTHKSPDFDRVLFEPLTDCEFKEYNIDTSLHNFPFASTLFSSQIGTQPPGVVRATAPLGTQSGLYLAGTVTADSSLRSVVSLPTKENESLNPNSPFVQPDGNTRMIYLRKRFDKSQPPNIRRQIHMKKQREWNAKHKAARGHQITMYRKYRIGELPDIQIKTKDIIEPLQALIVKDAALARLIFTELFKGVYEMEKEKEFSKDQIEKDIVRLLENTSNVTSFVGTLLRICFDHPELQIPPTLIGTTAQKSFNFHGGIMLLEKQILESHAREPKRRKLAVDSDKNQWIQLAKLYRAIGDEDTFKGIFEKELAKHEYTRQALNAELSRNFVEALNIYEKATKHLDDGKPWDTTPPSLWEEEHWENGRLECLAMLTRWNDLAENTLAEIENETSKLWNEKYLDPYLNYFIESHLKVKKYWPSLWEFVDSVYRDSKDPLQQERQSVLEKRFAPEMATLAITRNDFDASRYFVTAFYNAFAQQWGKLHSFDFAGRHVKLQSLQRIVELDEFLGFVGQESNFSDISPIQKLTQSWSNRYPSSSLDNILVWDHVVSNRSLMLEKLYDRYSQTHKTNEVKSEDAMDAENPRMAELKEWLVDQRATIFREMATASRKQSNYYVSDYYLRTALKTKAKQKDFVFSFFHSLVKLYCVKAKDAASPVESIDKYVKALKFIEGKKDEPEITQKPNNSRKFCLLRGDVYKTLMTFHKNSPGAVSDALANNLVGLDSHMSTLEVRAFESYDEALDICKQHRDQISAESISKTYFKFAMYCDGLLKMQSQSQNKLAKHDLPAMVINNILEAMGQSKQARDRFPRLLEIIETYPDTKGVFVQKCKEVPCWMFIRWISQMMARVNSPEGAAVVDILIQIAQNYPNSMYYPFKISSEDFNGFAKQITAPLKNLLSQNSSLNTFVDELEKLTHPEHRLKDYIDLLKPLMKPKDRDVQAITAIFHSIRKDLLDSPETAGSYNKKFANEWGKTILNEFGKDGSKLLAMSNSQFLTNTSDLLGKITKNLSRGTTKMKVSDFSPWISDFEQADQLSAECIEIPGQYDGLCKPLPATHVKVSSFDSNLLVMGSLRKPKRLKLHGNDERDYPFLVKGGEDLRLDQRVQQVFSVMNEILQNDPTCAARRLKINTYQVVPMTSRVGMIQWLENTKPLKELIEEEIAKIERRRPAEVNILKLPAAALYEAWMKSFADRIVGNKRGMCDLYYSMFQHATRAETCLQVEKQQNSLQPDLLKRGIAALALSPETYLSIRAQFARTLGVFNICSYIVGIGDRHLENFLLNLANGSLIGIDFGHAFGTATQFLPIPELMPFRLTRQFTDFLQPLEVDGMLKHNMLYTLKALQENKDILLNTMDVFIKEPLIDWEKLARRVAQDQGREDSSQWFPKKKIEIVRRKLDGDNPAYITVSELKESVHATQPHIKQLQRIVMGDPAIDVRAKAKEKCASTKEQVDCLVNQATDPNILGRTYSGWAPWI